MLFIYEDRINANLGEFLKWLDGVFVANRDNWNLDLDDVRIVPPKDARHQSDIVLLINFGVSKPMDLDLDIIREITQNPRFKEFGFADNTDVKIFDRLLIQKSFDETQGRQARSLLELGMNLRRAASLYQSGSTLNEAFKVGWNAIKDIPIPETKEYRDRQEREAEMAERVAKIEAREEAEAAAKQQAASAAAPSSTATGRAQGTGSATPAELASGEDGEISPPEQDRRVESDVGDKRKADTAAEVPGATIRGKTHKEGHAR